MDLQLKIKYLDDIFIDISMQPVLSCRINLNYVKLSFNNFRNNFTLCYSSKK